jgi:outer membrane receptor protein involved in Fe transport
MTGLSGALVTLVPTAVAAQPRDDGNGNTASARPSIRSSTTDSTGAYRFDSLPPGKYRLHITSDGYIPVEIDIELARGADLSLSASLGLEPVQLQPLPQDTTAVITGRVTDAETGLPLANVEVTVEGTVIRGVTDAEGRYWLTNVPPGPQTLRTRRIGYAPNRMPLTVPVSGTLTQDIRIAVSALLVEGITVTGDAVSRATGEMATATVIDIEAVRHQNATSLRNVLELVPGVEAEPPGLDDFQQIALRVAPTATSSFSAIGTTAEDMAAFGTLIVLNDVPLSNNANLQVAGRSSQVFFNTNAGGGIDLRKIPARTIERVEVIRGVPSARYGDLTQGAIVVETRAGEVHPEVSLQFDERTLEASLVAGHAFSGPGHAGTVTFDVARTNTSPGRTPDASYRLAGQLSHRAGLGTAPLGASQPHRWMFDTRIDAYQLRDDRPAHPESRSWVQESNDRGIRISERARMALPQGAGLSFTGSLNAVRQRATASMPLTRGPMPITDRLTAGRSVGRYAIGEYTAASTLEGNPWLLFGRFEADAMPRWLGLSHLARGGMELRREWNTGLGYQFDITNPPQVTFNGVNGFARPRSNDDIPSLVTSSFYLDDRITTALGGDMLFTVQAGVRLDLLHRGEHWFTAVRDAVLGPRINLEFSPWRWLRVRGGWGLVSKTPRMLQLYPDPQYYDVINVNWFTDEPEERLAVLTTFVEDPTNDDLGFATAEKAEFGFELGFGRSAISLVAFRDAIRDGIAIRGMPSFLLRDHYDLVDSTRGTGRPPEIVEPAAYSDTVPILLDVPANVMTLTSRGLELTASFPEIPFIRTRFNVIGQWIESEQVIDALYFGSQYRFGEFSLLPHKERTPYWGGATDMARRILATYRIIHHQPELGLVITGILQHNISDYQENLAGTDTLAYLGYVTRDGQMVPVPESERGNPEYHDLRIPRTGTLKEPRDTPADWMLGVQVAKTFPLDGRLSFWAYNVLDRTGIYGDVDVAPRWYASMRFGLELMMPVRSLFGWAY